MISFNNLREVADAVRTLPGKHEAVEAEAVKTYRRMLLEQPEEWLQQPVTPIATSYWRKEGNMWAARDEREPKTLRDVIELIARDELDHVAANSQKATAF